MTVYFINEGLSASNSGIEHAEFDRARVFRRNQVPFKFVTSVFIPKLHSILPMFAIRDSESINMFDYFQGALDIPTNPMRIQDVDFGVDVETKEDGLHHMAYVGEHFLGRIVLSSEDIVARIEYFDPYGNLYQVSHYDSRGFETLKQWYSPDNQIEVEVWLDVNGKPVIEKTYTPTRSGRMETWKVHNRTFKSLDELRLYFYNQLNMEGDNMFLIDRTNVAEWQLLQLDKPAYVVFVLHNHQASDATNPDIELLNDNYEWSLFNMDNWDAIVSSTPQQTRDIKNRWGDHHKCFTVPVGVIPEIQFQVDPIPMSARKHHSMLATARVAPEKGMDKMIKALAIARKTIPDLTLDLYGYVDHGNDDLAMKRINEALKELDDPSAVTLHGHTKDVGPLHESHQVYLIFSQMEGFNIALMEGQSKGMVTITNDVSYGPNELVKDGLNGYIVGYEDVEAFAEKMVELFSDDEKLQTMSDNAYDLSNRYSEHEVWKAWEPIFADFEAWIEAKA